MFIDGFYLTICFWMHHKRELFDDTILLKWLGEFLTFKLRSIIENDPVGDPKLSYDVSDHKVYYFLYCYSCHGSSSTHFVK